MKTGLAFALVGLLTASPAFAGPAGDTPNTGPEGSGNFVAGLAGDAQNTGPEGSGNFVSGKAGNPANAKSTGENASPNMSGSSR
jgi:hypothetical protein